jgi:hypothetical protein
MAHRPLLATIEQKSNKRHRHPIFLLNAVGMVRKSFYESGVSSFWPSYEWFIAIVMKKWAAKDIS